MFRNPYNPDAPVYNTHETALQHYCSRRGLKLNQAQYGNDGLTKDEVAKLDIGFTPILKSR